jgi:hypothetical protein
MIEDERVILPAKDQTPASRIPRECLWRTEAERHVYTRQPPDTSALLSAHLESKTSITLVD